MIRIKLHDRVKLDDGCTGSIVYDSGEGDLDLPLLCIFDDGGRIWLDRIAASVTEIIGHRYFVDTPFEIGKTYETKGGKDHETVVGVGLICQDQYGICTYRKPDGMTDSTADFNLVLPAKPEPEPTCDGKTVEIDGKTYRLSLVEDNSHE